MTIGLLIAAGLLSRSWMTSWLRSLLHAPAGLPTLADAQAAISRGEWEQAITAARQLLEADADQTEVVVLLARALLYHSYSDIQHERDRLQALRLTESRMRLDPGNHDLQSLYALALQANQRPEDAARIALRTIAIYPDQVSARVALSLSYGSQGIFEAALREAQRAVEIAASAPDWSADAYRALAIAWSDLGDYEQAARAIEQAIDQQKRWSPLYFERALYALQVGDMDSATAYYFNVIAIDPENIKARYRLCEVSSNLGERQSAIDWCTQVTQRAPGWSDGWYRLGREYFLQGDFYGAKDAFQRCSTLQIAQGIPIEERRFECWYLQGQAAEVIGDCDHLLPLYEQFQQMAAAVNLPQTWVYPPGGPAICATPVPMPAG
jgi:tetratricopeptide (TPR) repeat protein